MEMLIQKWLFAFLIIGSGSALPTIPHRTAEESLKSALDTITRKQRSLDTNSPEYYNDLRSFKYHEGQSERIFDRDRPSEREIEEEDDEEIEFLPNEVGQLETVGNGFPDLNNKLLERAFIDYLENVAQQEVPVTSLFRERERSSNRKRGRDSERLSVDNRELTKLCLEALQKKSVYSVDDVNDWQKVYDLYKGDPSNKLYENSEPRSWVELLNKCKTIRGEGRETEEDEFIDREQDPNLLYLTMGERRTVNGGYPLERSLMSYRNVAKHYPVAKRSPKPLSTEKQVTDPKVVQDLGALFGTQAIGQNHTHNHNYQHNHEYEHNHNHDHDNEHDYSDQLKYVSTSETPKVTPTPKGQKENTMNLNKTRSIEVRKKSVDWSQYFGIDRRRKKATFMTGQGTDQDDEWMLQRYYENMEENLKANDKDYGKEINEQKDKLEQLNLMEKDIKDMIVEKATKNADTEGDMDLQKVKDKLMARMAAAFSYEKMKKALSDLSNNVALLEAKKTAYVQNNQTSNFRENSNTPRAKEKRTQNNLIEAEAMGSKKACPELEMIKDQCRFADSLAGDESRMLYLPCVMLQICKACVNIIPYPLPTKNIYQYLRIQHDLEEVCLSDYAVKADKICTVHEMEEGKKGREACASTALILSQLQPPAGVSAQCRTDGKESCLRRYHFCYFLHRYRRYPYAERRLNSGYERNGAQHSDR